MESTRGQAISDEIRYNAYILCTGGRKDQMEREIEMEENHIPRSPRDGWAQNDVMINSSLETLKYAHKNYELLRNALNNDWQSLFEFLREKERLPA